jgi:hypothetical protein
MHPQRKSLLNFGFQQSVTKPVASTSTREQKAHILNKKDFSGTLVSTCNPLGRRTLKCLMVNSLSNNSIKIPYKNKI